MDSKSADAELAELLRLMQGDGMQVFWGSLKSREVVYLKSILEAYPGVVSLHALPRKPGTPGGGDRLSRLAMATTARLGDEVRTMLQELGQETGLKLEEGSPAWTTP